MTGESTNHFTSQVSLYSKTDMEQGEDETLFGTEVQHNDDDVTGEADNPQLDSNVLAGKD